MSDTIQNLSENDAIQVVFKDKQGKEHILEMYPGMLKELLEETAYEHLTEPECNSSSCAVNNFCECEPDNEDIEFDSFRVRLTLTK